MKNAPSAPLSAGEMIELCRAHTLFSWSAQSKVDPIPMARGEGVYFWDANGKRYLDFSSLVVCVNIGHGHPRVIQAIQEQAGRLTYAAPSMASEPRARLGEILSEVTPGDLDVFFFTLGGAEANENAIKIARAYTGRSKILARYRSYHGATHGALSLTGDPRRWPWEPALPGVVHFLDPYRYRSVFHRGRADLPEEEFSQDYLNHLEEVIQFEGPGNIAAVLIETVTGTNGLIIPPVGYLQGLRDICTRYGILLVCDEVMTGFGRTGKWFAVDHWGVVPDLMTMAKGLTSSYAPLGAVAMRAEIAQAFDNRVFQSGLTFNSHPLSLAAAIANIEVIRDEKLVERSAQMGKVLSRHLAEMEERHPSVGEVRSIGLFGMIELVRDRRTHEPLAPFNGTSVEMQRLSAYFRERGLYTFFHWNNFFVAPPLVVTEGQLDEGFRIVDEGLTLTDEDVRR
ncbi:MAG: aminotransferase class III-fold pyridoxal phosphate-dependent enzyme [Anaerolineales bacterium]|jgi:taurine--2-oxoglutarate transaminase